VRLVRSFLDGADDGPMEVLRTDMQAASELMDFERAAVLRDKLQRLEGLREQFIRFRFAVETLSFIYTVPGHDGDDRLYLIRRGRVRGEYEMPRSEQDRIRLLEMVEQVFNPSDRDTAQVPAHEIDELLLLSSWFRRFPAELGRSRDAKVFVADPPPLGYDPRTDPLFGDSASSAA
jgi:excinuclease ABC subunit C